MSTLGAFASARLIVQSYDCFDCNLVDHRLLFHANFSLTHTNLDIQQCSVGSFASACNFTTKKKQASENSTQSEVLFNQHSCKCFLTAESCFTKLLIVVMIQSSYISFYKHFKILLTLWFYLRLETLWNIAMSSFAHTCQKQYQLSRSIFSFLAASEYYKRKSWTSTKLYTSNALLEDIVLSMECLQNRQQKFYLWIRKHTHSRLLLTNLTKQYFCLPLQKKELT